MRSWRSRFRLIFDLLIWPPRRRFLSSYSWPFHNPSALSVDLAAKLEVASESVESCLGSSTTDRQFGVVRLFDLDDIDRGGSPLFDLRIADEHLPRRGIGTQAVTWLTNHLFVAHPALHRIEATTRSDTSCWRCAGFLSGAGTSWRASSERRGPTRTAHVRTPRRTRSCARPGRERKDYAISRVVGVQPESAVRASA